MSNINERLDRFKEFIQDASFLESRGLSNEVNIRIFCYKPEEEMTIQHFIEKLSNEKNLKCNLKIFNLYDVFLDICEKKKIINAIPKMENKKGIDFLVNQLHSNITPREFANTMSYEPHEIGKDVVILIGIGEVFPYMRIHALLETIQPTFSDIPVVVIYPGSFNGQQLRLFNKLQPSDYYRAFNLV